MSNYPLKSAAKIIEVALGELGYIEGPADNQTKYQKTNQPWCGAFINWVAKKSEVFVPNCVSTLAGAQSFEKMAAYHPAAKSTPKRGDIAFFDFPGDSLDRISHVGLVIQNGVNGEVITIEGNTSGTGSQRNGGMVMIKRRSYKAGGEIVGFGRPDYLSYSGPWPEIPDMKPKETAKPVKKGKKNG